MKIICWNVNGLRAIAQKNFYTTLDALAPDIICLQENKMQAHQVTQELQNAFGFFSHWAFASRPGYSGVTTYSKEKSTLIQKEIGDGIHDDEGRLLVTEHHLEDGTPFLLINGYFPNGGQGDHRIEYKLNYYDNFLDLCERLRAEGHSLVICGDFNTAHHPIDLARPRENEGTTGFLPVERAWLDKWTAHGYIDTFRHFYPETPEKYTWWSYRGGAKQRNVGWRIDYFFVTPDLIDRVKSIEHLDEVPGSDHCPLELVLG